MTAQNITIDMIAGLRAQSPPEAACFIDEADNETLQP